MLHTDEKKATFHYFASTMRKNNSDTENILYSMEKWTAPRQKKSQVSCLKKHVKDNIRTKMLALGIQNKSKLLGNSYSATAPKEG